MGVLLAHLLAMASPLHARMMSGPDDPAAMTQTSRAPGETAASMLPMDKASTDCAIRGASPPNSGQPVLPLELFRPVAPNATNGRLRLSNTPDPPPLDPARSRAFLQSFLI